MAHDVFISYSSKDKPVADAVCAALEAERVRCWIAPRDVLPGVAYGEAIIEALNETRLLVLIFTSNSNDSRHVMREVERAVNKGIPIIPFRVHDVRPTPAMEYFISSGHWLDALTPPLDAHIRKLVETVGLLRGREAQAAASTRVEPLSAATLNEPRPDATRDSLRPAAAATRGERPHDPSPLSRDASPLSHDAAYSAHNAAPRAHDAGPLPPPDAFATTPLAPFASAQGAHAASQVESARQANRRPLLVVGLVALAAVLMLAAALAFFWFGGESSQPAEVAGASAGAAARSNEPPRAQRTRPAGSGEQSMPRLALEGHAEQVRACAFSPDGKLLASGGDDNTVKLWDAATGELRQTVSGLDAAVLSLAFSPDGSLLAVGLNYATGQSHFPLHVYEVSEGRAGEVVRTLKNPHNAFWSVAFSADGKTLLGGSQPAMIWNTEDWSLKNDLIQPGINPAFALSPDGRLVATGGTNENPIKLWDAETGELKQTLEGHEKGVLSLAFSDDGRTLLSGSYDDTARLWDAETGELKQTLKEENLNAVFAVAFAPDGATVASGSYHSVKLWDTATGALKQTLTADQMGITYRLAFAPDGRTLAGASDKSIKLWDAGAAG